MKARKSTTETTSTAKWIILVANFKVTKKPKRKVGF